MTLKFIVEGVSATADADRLAAVVTTDARFAALAGAARRVADIGLLSALIDNPDADFQFFVLWTQPDQLAASGARVAALGAPNLPETHDFYLMRDAAPELAYLDRLPE